MIIASPTSVHWKAWNQQGLFPGPDETEEAFALRAVFCLNIQNELIDKVAELPFDAADEKSQEALDKSFPLSDRLWGIAPKWVPVFFSNYQLAPWHGGCAWIFQLNEETPTAAFLQLRAKFRASETYLGIYQRKELIAHELAHVGRMVYKEPQFEELLAYQSSASAWRRWLGPIAQSSKETLLFILLLGLVIMADIAALSIGTAGTPLEVWIKFIPIVFLLFALGRLSYRHSLLNKCLHRLESLLGNLNTARHLLYRLRDSEIRDFAKSSPQEICNSIEEASQHSFRWRFLKELYPFSAQK